MEAFAGGVSDGRGDKEIQPQEVLPLRPSGAARVATNPEKPWVGVLVFRRVQLEIKD